MSMAPISGAQRGGFVAQRESPFLRARSSAGRIPSSKRQFVAMAVSDSL